MHINRVYARYISETASEVVVTEHNKLITLQRCRMYNSHLDTKGFLYTDYADKEYVQKNATSTDKNKHRSSPNDVLTPSKRAEGARKGWESRRNKGR